MLQFIMEQNVLLYVLTAACVFGAASQLILKRIYERLIRDTKNAGEMEGKFQQQLRQRFQYCTHLNEKVGNVQALVQKSVMEYRVWGMNLHQWKRFGLQCLAVSLLCAFAGTMLLVNQSGTVQSAALYLWMAAGAVVVTAAAYGIADTRYRREALEIRLIDYLENSGAARDFKEAELEEQTSLQTARSTEAVTPILSVAQGRKAKRRAKAEAAQTRAQKEKADLKENLARVRAGLQETAAERERSEREQSDRERRAELLKQMDPKEQERILREVLQEFLS